MKILAIRIKNLASLEGNTEIDFTQEPLCSAGIFAITGPTGAGKSTILDALCLALYNKTPRYIQAKETGIEVRDVEGSKIGQSDVRAILRDGTADGFAEVDFVGIDKDCYRASWSVRRARSKAEGALQSAEVSLKNLTKNTDIGGRKTDLLPEIERLVGLNFEQFRRSVLLPQGDFTAFLKADKDEKSSLLEKLTGTEVYSAISRRVHERHRDELQKLRELNLKREGIETLSQEELDWLITRKEDQEKALREDEQQLMLLNKEIGWYQALATIKAECDQADDAFKQALGEKQNAKVRQQRLYQAEQVQVLRTWFDRMKIAEQQKTARQVALTSLEKESEVLQKEKERVALALKLAEEDLAFRIRQKDETSPLLQQARELDVQIRETASQLSKANEELQTAQKKKQEHDSQLGAKKEEAEKLKTEHAQLEQWKTENSSRQPIAENEAVIASKLSDAQKQLDALQELNNAQDKIQEEFAVTIAGKTELEGQYAEGNRQLQEVLARIEEELKALSSMQAEVLEDEKRKVDAVVEELIAADGQWNYLYRTITTHAQLQTSMEKNLRELDDNKNQFGELDRMFSTVQAQRDASLRMLQIAQQAVSKDVEALRSQLTAGEECPVCGSTEHPYVTSDRKLHDLLEEQKTEHERNEAAFASMLSRHGALQSACRQLEKLVAVQQEEIAAGELSLVALRDAWSSLEIQCECADIADSQKAGWLRDRLNDKRALQERLQLQISTYNQKRLGLERLKSDSAGQEKKLSLLSDQVKDAGIKQSFLEERRRLNDQSIERLSAELKDTERTLSPYFAFKSWFENWKAGPQAFLERISVFSSQWKQKSEQLEQLSRREALVSTSITGLLENSVHFTEEVETRLNAVSKLNAVFEDLKKQRNLIFSGLSVSEKEASLGNAIESARAALDGQNTKTARLETDSARLRALREQAIENITSLEKQVEECSGEIGRWLSGYNSRNTPPLEQKTLDELLSLPTEWIEFERSALKAIDDAVTRSGSIAEERRAAYVSHEQQRLSLRDYEDLIQAEKDLKERIRGEQEECNGISFRLRQDQENKQKITGILHAVESQSGTVELWAKLYDVIGSADGKKFRQIAQEYTLDVLLSFANVHLEMLSSRYILQRIPQTLGLQVVDQDMGDEVRTVFSLSGGESFLVSLALALGLASLSSNRMKVESLFIDEGFGSLDPQTLNIAMDALERLYNQGRKVGVISHVQEMTERIPVQIRVSKQSSGKSLVEVM